MTFDFKNLEKQLAQNKVYDAWQYIQSLRETISFMEISFEMLKQVYQHRKDTLASVEAEKYKEIGEKGKTALMISDLEKTHLDIGGYELDDVLFLRKTAMEFFHYGRMSMDVLFQVINAALLGDEAFPTEDKGLLSKLLKKLSTKNEFQTLLQILDANKNDGRFQYLVAFDNYMKHIKNVLITVKNSIFIGNDAFFDINEFSYGGIAYPKEDALSKIQQIYDYVVLTIPDILSEIVMQLPNCMSNGSRFQEIHYKHVFTEREGKDYLEYVSFFIDVPNGITDLPSEIKVYPLLIKPNDEIYGFDFRFDKIFIKKAGSDERDVVGVATLKNSGATDELYKVYEVKPCTPVDFGLYIATFKETYASKKINMNIYAMDGIMIFIKETPAKDPDTSSEDIDSIDKSEPPAMPLA